MRAKKCDRCGKLYEHYDGMGEFKQSEKANAFIMIDKDLDNKYFSRKNFDLCPECMKGLENFIYGGDIPRAGEFKCVFEKKSPFGTIELEGKTFKVYMGEYTESVVCGITKRKFTVIEV